jgi:hypothetical protein
MISVPNRLTTTAVPTWIGKWLRDNATSTRSRILLVGLAFTIVASGLIILDSADSRLSAELAEQQQRLARIDHLGTSELWYQRRTDTDAVRVQAEGRLWEAETDGLAQANFQTWVIDVAARAGIGQIEIHTSINQTVNNPLKLRQLTAQISGRFEAGAMFKLLQAIAGHNRLLIVNRLEIQIVPMPRFEMWLGTYLRPARTS